MELSVYGLKGKVAVVTGAGSGIGRGIAREMAKAGADVVVAEINPEGGEETVDMVSRVGGNAIMVETDVTGEESVDQMLKAVLSRFGRADMLVNNVGGLGGKPRKTALVEMSRKNWDDVIALNLTSQFLCCKAFISHWTEKKRGGNIVNISSLGGMVPYETSVAYGAAKAGVINMTATLASEYGKQNIRVNCVAPGHVKTPITEGLYRGREELRKAQDRIIPMGRYGDPDELGRVVVFLASDASSYITGQTLLVSGGMLYFLTRLP